jgi:hypothetical protein
VGCRGRDCMIVEPVGCRGRDCMIVEPVSCHGRDCMIVEPVGCRGHDCMIVEPVGCRGRDCIIVGVAPSYVMSTYTTANIDATIKLVSKFRQVDCRYYRFPPPWRVESCPVYSTNMTEFLLKVALHNIILLL